MRRREGVVFRCWSSGRTGEVLRVERDAGEDLACLRNSAILRRCSFFIFCNYISKFDFAGKWIPIVRTGRMSGFGDDFWFVVESV